MLLNDKLRAHIANLEGALRQSQRELLSVRLAKITGDGSAAKERLREAIDTVAPRVMVSNDDLFDLLWRDSLKADQLKQLTAELERLNPPPRRLLPVKKPSV